ncbi:MAG: thioredoxin domain-containing protein [Rhodobacteraceae bacterium]|nr:thioredoxin domain-containing protein [Paracoccaceae bacterium]
MTHTLTRRAALALMSAATGTAVFAQESGDAPVVQEIAIGDPNAPITIVEYASYTCPHCANFHADVFPELKANFIDTGKVHFIFRPVYFDGPGLWADMLARCTGDSEKYLGIAGILFEQQAEWSRAGSQAGVAQGIVSVGNQAGISEDTVLACLQDNDMAQALVADFQMHAERDNVEGTPSFVIDGVMTDNMSYASFAQLLNEKLGE